MPLHLVCPCGHSAPLPDPLESRPFVCSKCKSRIELVCFDGESALHQWFIAAARGAALPARVRFAIQFIPTPIQSQGANV